MSRRPPNATRAPVPMWTRRVLWGGAVLLVVAAAVVNISHTRRNADQLGQDDLTVAVVGVLPDFGLPLSFLRLRHYPRSVWGWAGICVSVGLIAWSALVSTDARYGVEGHVMSLVCLTFAIIAAGQAHVPAGETPEILLAHVEALADDAVLAAKRAVLEARELTERAVADATERADLSRRRADELEGELTAERAKWADDRAELAARASAHATAQPAAGSAHDEPSASAHREPSRRLTSSAKAQVRPEIAAELTTAEVTVLSWLLGRGEQQLQAIVDGSRVPLSTVKRALGGLIAKGHVTTGDGRGRYRSVDPDFGSLEPSEPSGRTAVNDK